MPVEPLGQLGQRLIAPVADIGEDQCHVAGDIIAALSPAQHQALERLRKVGIAGFEPQHQAASR